MCALGWAFLALLPHWCSVGIQSHQFSDGTLHKSAFKLCISHDANQRSCLSTSTIAKQAVAKHTVQVTWLFYGCGTTLAMMLMMLMHQCELFRTDGRTDEQMEVIGEPEVNPTPRVSKVRSGQPFHSATY